MSEKVKYVGKIVGHIIDRKIPKKIFNKVSEFFYDGVIDIKNIKISYPSCRIFRSEQEPSIMKFCISGKEEKVLIAIREIKDICRTENCRVIYFEEEERLVEYHIRMAGHIIEKNIMPQLSQLFEEKNIDLEDVKISYDSMKAFEDKVASSILDFYLVGSEKILDKALDTLEEFAKANSCRFIFISRAEKEEFLHYTILGDIIEDRIMDEIAALFEDCNDIDVVDIEISYGSMKECAEKRGPAILDINLMGPESVMLKAEGMLDIFIEKNNLRTKEKDKHKRERP